MRILFVGESWLGSCARSLKEALTRQPGVDLDEVNEDLFFPKHQAKWVRSINRLLRGAYKRELERQALDLILSSLINGSRCTRECSRGCVGWGLVSSTFIPSPRPTRMANNIGRQEDN